MPDISEFDEHKYLLANPDVAEAVREGVLTSGAEHYELYGRQEGRTWQMTTLRSRQDKILNNIDTRGKGLEIGPSHNPVAPKSHGFDVDIVDHLDSQGLKRKYADGGLDLDKIEEVDFVWNGELLSELIGKDNYYDWIIASHVIEHIPDPITFLQQCEVLLKPGGRLALVVPDKRYCFDYFQPIDLTGSWLDAFHQKRTRPTPGQVFEHLSNACSLDQLSAWSAGHSGSLELLYSMDLAAETWNRARQAPEYFDVHCWRFSHASFKLILSDLSVLELLALSVVEEYATDGCEFYVVLEKSATKHVPANRLEMLLASGVASLAKNQTDVSDHDRTTP